MRKLLSSILTGAALTLALTAVTAAPSHADTPNVTVGSPCYEPIHGTTWIYWTVTNNTSEDIVASITNDTTPPDPSSFTIPAGGSVVRETIGGWTVDVTVAGVVVASASIPPHQLTACGTATTDFNLIVDCRPNPYQVTLWIKNATDKARPYKLTKQRGEELTGTALPGNMFITEDWVKPTDRWSLEIAGYKYVRVVNEPALCDASSPTPTPTATTNPSPKPTVSTTPMPTGPSDPDPTTPAPSATPTPDPEPTMAPVSSVTDLGSGNGALTVGFAGLVIGLALGFSVAMQMRRRSRNAQ